MKKHSGPRKYSRLSSRQNPPPTSKLADRGAKWTSSFKQHLSLFALVLQHARTVSKPGHTLLCEVPSTYMAPHTFSSSSALAFSSCLSFYLCSRTQLWENRAGERVGGAGSSDERQWWRRCGTIHETSSIYWWREHIAQTQRAHHTGTLSFKFSLSLSTSPVSIRTEKAHISATTWFPHEWTHSNTTNSKAPPSLNVSPITPPNPWRPNANKRQLNTRLINLSIIPHAFLCNLMNYWWAAISRLSCSCEVFAGGKLQIAQKSISLMMSDVIPDPYNFTNTDLLQIIMHSAHVHPLRCGFCVLVCV